MRDSHISRLFSWAAIGQALLAMVAATVWFARRRPKLFVAILVLVAVMIIGQVLAYTIKSGQNRFLGRMPTAEKAEKPAEAVKPVRVKPLETSQSIPVETPHTPTSLPSSLPPFFEVGDNLAEAQALGRALSAARFGDGHWDALYKLWHAESGWNPAARNRSSGACGIPQALPCRKIPDMSLRGQLEWGISYIEQRYGNPTNAWRFWQRHHWY